MKELSNEELLEELTAYHDTPPAMEIIRRLARLEELEKEFSDLQESVKGIKEVYNKYNKGMLGSVWHFADACWVAICAVVERR